MSNLNPTENIILPSCVSAKPEQQLPSRRDYRPLANSNLLKRKECERPRTHPTKVIAALDKAHFITSERVKKSLRRKIQPCQKGGFVIKHRGKTVWFKGEDGSGYVSCNPAQFNSFKEMLEFLIGCLTF